MSTADDCTLEAAAAPPKVVVVNASLLRPAQFGWTAGGGIADLSTPQEVCVCSAWNVLLSMWPHLLTLLFPVQRTKKSSQRVRVAARNSRKRSRRDAFCSRGKRKSEESLLPLGSSETPGETCATPCTPAARSLDARQTARQDDGVTIDLLAFYQGRDVVQQDPGEGDAMVATVAIHIPISEDAVFRESMAWNLADPATPSPMEFATTMGSQFGLDYPMIWDLAHSIQTQLADFVHASYTEPERKGAAAPMVPYLYGDVTGFAQPEGFTHPLHPPKSRGSGLCSESFLAGRSLSGRSFGSHQPPAVPLHRLPSSSSTSQAIKSKHPAADSGRRRTVPKLPISEFPREVSNGKDLDFAWEDAYQTLYLKHGSFLIQKNELPADATALAVAPDDGSVDFCNVCKTVGDLICCDFCPRAFHCGCLPRGAMPESMDDEAKWECSCCIEEREGLPSDHIVDTPALTSIAEAYEIDMADVTMAQHATVLGIVHEMLCVLMDYDFGDVFRRPVNGKEIPSYHTIVKKPMDLGTICTKLLKGRYERKSLEGVILAVLKDVELVWHNCFIFNVEGSAVYRMANIHKRRAHSIRQRSFDHLISDRVKLELADYITSLELERDNHRRLDALTTQSKTAMAQSPVRHKILGPPSVHAKQRPVAVLDADSGRLMKVYSTLPSACNAVTFIFNLKRYECEWDFNDICTPVKFRQNVMLPSSENPEIRLYGYRWLYLDKLRNRSVKFSRPQKPKIPEPVEEEVFTIPDDPIMEELVEVVQDEKSFIFRSVAEALSFPGISGNACELDQQLQRLVPGTDFQVIGGSMWKRCDPDEFDTYGIAYVKEDTICGDTILCGFLHIQAAYEDWCRTLDASITTTEAVRSLDLFSRSYLNQNRYVDGIRWRHVAPTRVRTEDDSETVVAQSKVGTSVSRFGLQETSSSTTHSTDNSNTSKVYDLETVPSPKSPLKLGGGGDVEENETNGKGGKILNFL